MNKSTHLKQRLRKLHLTHIAEHYEAIAREAAGESLSHVDYLHRLIDAESSVRYERSVARRIRDARLPLVKTLDSFDWSWPEEINKAAVTDLFRMQFIEHKANAVLLGGVGLGKTHLALALAHSACLENIPVLFTTAVQIVNTLGAAQATHNLHKALKAYLKPRLLVIDELGFVPMDKESADLFFQVISSRYEQSSTVITTNIAYNEWAGIFDNNAPIAAAILDRLVHHCYTIVIEGDSYRMHTRNTK